MQRINMIAMESARDVMIVLRGSGPMVLDIQMFVATGLNGSHSFEF